MKCQALCSLMEIEPQIEHGPYTQDPQSLLGNTEIKANNSNTMQSDTCDNRGLFQALYVPNRKGTNLLRCKEGLS